MVMKSFMAISSIWNPEFGFLMALSFYLKFLLISMVKRFILIGTDLLHEKKTMSYWPYCTVSKASYCSNTQLLFSLLQIAGHFFCIDCYMSNLLLDYL